MQMTEALKFNMPTLADRAMLVRLSRSMYQPYAFDRETTDKVEAQTGVRRAGRFNKRLMLDCYQLDKCNAAFNDLYSFHMNATVPWLDDGMRMLPSDQYFDYQQVMRGLIDECNKQADNLASVWDLLVAEDMARLGPLANSNDYPSDIRSRYSASLKFMPIPTANDFRVAISDEDRDSLNNAIAEAEAGVTKYLISELLDPVRKAVEKLAVPIGEKGSIFRDSLLENITEQIERARKLNIGNDPSITNLCDDIVRAVGGYALAPEVLRESIDARADARAKLDDIMSKMAGVF